MKINYLRGKSKNYVFIFLNKNLKLKKAIVGLFWPKMKKKNGFWKEMKSLLYKSAFIFAQKCIRQDIRLFIFFSSYPFGGILDTLPLLWFQFIFLCFFTNNQPQIYLTVRELFSKRFVFWHALLGRWGSEEVSVNRG